MTEDNIADRAAGMVGDAAIQALAAAALELAARLGLDTFELAGAINAGRTKVRADDHGRVFSLWLLDEDGERTDLGLVDKGAVLAVVRGAVIDPSVN